jgi:hypothetical protein
MADTYVELIVDLRQEVVKQFGGSKAVARLREVGFSPPYWTDECL